MKVVIALIALSFFFLLSDVTQNAKRQETPQAVKKQDFIFRDFNHQTTMTGNWVDKDYVIEIQINSIKLDLKLVYTYDKSPADVNSTPNDNRTPKNEKIHRFENCPEYPRNATCPAFETSEPRTPGLMKRVIVAATTQAWGFPMRMMARSWNFALTTGNKCYNITLEMAARTWNSVAWLAEWIFGKVVWLAECIWVEATWLADWIQERGAWLSEWIWDTLIWLGERIWDGITWTGNPFVPMFNYVTNVIATFYDGYLDEHVKNVEARIVTMTWQDVVFMMCTVVVVNFFLLVGYMLVKCTVNFIRRRW
ncbi:hypothetical protein ACROYT_G021265 [Oculina patagonica]